MRSQNGPAEQRQSDNRPVGEAHSILLDVQRGEFLVVAQSLLLLAGDSQVKTQHGV